MRHERGSGIELNNTELVAGLKLLADPNRRRRFGDTLKEQQDKLPYKMRKYSDFYEAYVEGGLDLALEKTEEEDGMEIAPLYFKGGNAPGRLVGLLSYAPTSIGKFEGIALFPQQQNGENPLAVSVRSDGHIAEHVQHLVQKDQEPRTVITEIFSRIR